MQLSVSNPGFTKPETRVLWLFSTTRNLGYFTDQIQVFKKTWNCCCIQILMLLITFKLQIGVGSGRINLFELSTIIIWHRVWVFLGEHHTFCVGPFIFSFHCLI